MAQDDTPTHAGALAGLRPGMPATSVAEAMGDAWRAPAPFQGGVVDTLQYSHGIVIRLTRDGVVGQVRYAGRFGDAEVEGLRMGMTVAEARTRRPDLEIGDTPARASSGYGVRVMPGGVRLFVTFSLGRVSGIEFNDPNADYAKPTPPPYPAPSGEPGAPFADANLKLVVLSSLLAAKVIHLGKPGDLAAHVLTGCGN